VRRFVRRIGVLQRIKAHGLDLLDVPSYAIAPLCQTSEAESRDSGGTSINPTDEGRWAWEST